ncbi:MAG: recombinase family protein [Anaerolineales bacterium]|nr:recombinase family protein [Anaerolineales bacterium]
MERPISDDPHDQLVLQIRGAVAEYERSLIAERMRRGRQSRLKAGLLLPWTTAPYGYILDAEQPRDPSGVRLHEVEAAIIQQIFGGYSDPEARPSLYAIAKQLSDDGVPTPTGQPRWNAATIRGILTNPAYTGTAYANRSRPVPARQRKSAMLPLGSGQSQRPTPKEVWIPIPVPAIVTQEQFDQAQARLALNKQMARRNNTQHDYLLRGLVSCAQCHLSCQGRTRRPGYSYYVCRGKTDALRAAKADRCQARYAPAEQLDELVWQDLVQLLSQPELIIQALQRAQTGEWLPQQLQARRQSLNQALAQLARQEERLLEAYLAEVIELAELERKRQDITHKQQALDRQVRQLETQLHKQLEIGAITPSIEAFCQRAQQGLAQATFAQKRELVELLIDRVVIDDAHVEIHYVIPTTEASTHTRFCHLRKDYFDLEPEPVIVNQFIVSEFQVTTEQDHIGAGLSFEIEFVDDDHIELVGKEFVPHEHVIDVGLDTVQDSGFLKILVRDVGIVEFGSILFASPPFLLGAGIRKIERGISPQLGNQMERALADHLQGLVVTKSPIHNTIADLQTDPQQCQKLGEHGLDAD